MRESAQADFVTFQSRFQPPDPGPAKTRRAPRMIIRGARCSFDSIPSAQRAGLDCVRGAVDDMLGTRVMVRLRPLSR